MNQKVLVFIGTKAILLKMSPIIQELARLGKDFAIVDTGQHADLAFELAKNLDMPSERIQLSSRKKPVSKVWEGIVWLLGLALLLFRSRSWLSQSLFKTSNAIALVHGDTASTLLACLLARRAGYKVVHIESGLRSFNWLSPFPEELIRILVMRFAHTLIAPSIQAFENIKSMGLQHKAIYIEGNTGMDAVRQSLAKPSSLIIPFEYYGVATLHRMETIYNESKFDKAMQIILEAASHQKIVFVTHKVTESKLNKDKYRKLMSNESVHFINLVDHSSFIHLINNAQFVLTDGGSIQEEASYLGVPCLILREFTERQDGIGRNVVLSRLDEFVAKKFFSNLTEYKFERNIDLMLPSEKIVSLIYVKY